MSGPPAGGGLLGLLEPGWRRHLASGEPARTVNVGPEMLDAVARTLGELSRSEPPTGLSRQWPACVVVAVAQIAAHRDKTGKVWPTWHRAIGTRATKRSAGDWAEAFLGSLAALGVPALADDPLAAVHVHATAPDRTVAADHDPPFGGLLHRLDPFGRGVLTRDMGHGAEQVRADADSAVTLSPEEVTDPADPLLAFDADGEPIAGTLPPEAVWLVYPHVRALRADIVPRVLVESRLPLTWKGWRLVQLDLSAVAWIELAPAGDDAPRRHQVRRRSKPWLVTGAPVPGIRTSSGLAVFGALPGVRLPAGEVRWRAEVRRAGSGPVLAAVEASGDRWEPECLWDLVPRPVLGELVLTVTPLGGAPGTSAPGTSAPGTSAPGTSAPGTSAPGTSAPVTGLRRVVAVAEGLDVGYSPALRLTGDVGLEPAEVVLRPAPGMTVSPCAAAIPADVTGIKLACVAGPVVLPLRVTPPHCRTRIEPEPGSGDAAAAWHSLGPLPLETADLIRGGGLRLDLPGTSGDPPIDVVAARGRVVQVLAPSKRGAYPLRRLLDTVKAHGGAELRITVSARTAVIARISASAPAADPWLSG